MRLVFKKLRTPASTIKVSFNGETYRTYDVNTIKNQGYIEFTEQDCPDLTKLKIQGQFSTIDSIEVNKNILIEGTTEGLLCNYEAEVFNHIHYNCYTYDDNNNNLSDESIDESWPIWVNANNENDVVACEDEGMPSSSNELVPLTTFNPHGIFFIDDTHDTLICPILNYQRYPNGDINGDDYHYYCFIKSNIINNPGAISSEYCVWLKDEISETAEVYKMYKASQSGLCLDVAELSIYAEPNYINLIREVNNIIYFDSINPSDQGYFLRDPNGDIDMRRGSGEMEPASDIITEIQDTISITKNGSYIADEGKAFKNINVDIDLGFKCFYSGAEFFNFPGQNPDMSLQGLSFICNIMISYKYAENLYHQLFPNGRYNNIIGIRYYDPKQNPVEYWYTIVNEYELLSFDCLNGIGTISFLFLEHNPYEGYTENPGIVEVALSSGRVINMYDPAPICQ